MIAGFLHDIGHGPFSHAIDFALKRLHRCTHEELSSKLIEEQFNAIEPHADLKKISQTVTGKYEYPFITKIITGPIDIDRLDYLMRDSYHVGLRYYFDAEHFIHKYTLIGLEYEEKSLSPSFYSFLMFKPWFSILFSMLAFKCVRTPVAVVLYALFLSILV